MQTVRVALFKRSDKPNTISHCPCIHLICIYINDAGALCCKVRSNERTWIRLLFSFRAFDSLNNNYTLLKRFPCSRGEAGSGSAKPLLSGCFLFHFPHKKLAHQLFWLGAASSLCSESSSVAACWGTSTLHFIGNFRLVQQGCGSLACYRGRIDPKYPDSGRNGPGCWEWNRANGVRKCGDAINNFIAL